MLREGVQRSLVSNRLYLYTGSIKSNIRKSFDTPKRKKKKNVIRFLFTPFFLLLLLVRGDFLCKLMIK